MNEAQAIAIAEAALGPDHGMRLERVARDSVDLHLWALSYEIEDCDGGPSVLVDERTGEATVITGL